MELIFDLLNTVELDLGVRNLGISVALFQHLKPWQCPIAFLEFRRSQKRSSLTCRPRVSVFQSFWLAAPVIQPLKQRFSLLAGNFFGRRGTSISAGVVPSSPSNDLGKREPRLSTWQGGNPGYPHKDSCQRGSGGQRSPGEKPETSRHKSLIIRLGNLPKTNVEHDSSDPESAGESRSVPQSGALSRPRPRPTLPRLGAATALLPPARESAPIQEPEPPLAAPSPA